MRAVGSPSINRLFGASLITLATGTVSLTGCGSDPVRHSGNRDGSGSTQNAGNDGSGGSSAGGTGAIGGSGDPAGGTGTAGTDPGTAGTGPSAGTAGSGGDASSAGTGSSAGDTTTGAGGSLGGSAGSTAEGGTGNMPCQMANYTFAPKIPTVFLLVDQSGSMWDCQTGGASDPQGRGCADHANTSWYPLRDGALTVIQALEADVRFGFSAFTGEIGDPICPNMMPVTPEFNNYEAIAAQYNALMPPEKGETPTRKALEQVGEILMADEAPGDRFILFVTDGEPDYCDDQNKLCPPDSVVGALQTLATGGIKTLVFGLAAPATVTQAAESVLAAFANAGDGQPVARPGTTDPLAFYDQCRSIAGWEADFLLTGKPDERGGEVGLYTDVGGTATVFKPEATNQQALVDLLSAALSGVKSCTFDLSNVNGQSIKVDLNKLGEATVAIQGTTIPQDATNGWSMASETQLVLNGSSCDTWRTPENNDIAFNFPCNTIIFE